MPGHAVAMVANLSIPYMHNLLYISPQKILKSCKHCHKLPPQTVCSGGYDDKRCPRCKNPPATKPRDLLGNFLLRYIKECSLKSKCAPAVGFHKVHDLATVSAFVIGHQQTLEFRDMAFGNDDQTLAFGDHIMVRKDH